MPIYEYVCMECESHFEELVRSSGQEVSCPDCESAKVVKQFSVFAAHGTAAQPSFGGGGRLLRRKLWLRALSSG